MITPDGTGRRRAAGALCAAVASACGGATPALADSLTAARVITPPGAVVCEFALATSPVGGRVALLYQAGENCGGEPQGLFARLGRGRNLGPARALESRTSHSGAKQVRIFGAARLAVGANGSGLAAWIARGREAGHDHLRVAIAPPGQRFGRARTLARARSRAGYVPDIQVVDVVAGRAGQAVVSWALSPRGSGVASLRVAVRTRGRFGAPQALGPFSRVYYAPPAPAFALAPSGAIVAAWRPGERPTAVAATLRAGRRRFGAVRKISGGDVAEHVQAVAGPGGAGASWSDDRRQVGTPIRLRLARLRRDGAVAPAQTIAEVDSDRGSLEVDGAQVAFPLAGPVAAWQVFRDISEAGDGRIDRTRVDAAAFAAGAFGGPQSLSTPGALTSGPLVGALTDRALVAWRERAGTAWRLRLAVRRSGGAWQPPQTLAETGGLIAVAASRRSALVAWQTVEPQIERRRVLLAVYRP